MSRPSKLCHDQETASQPSKLCCDQKLYRDQETMKNKKKGRKLIFWPVSNHFTLGLYIYSFFLVKRATGRGDNTSHGVSLSKLPIFSVFLQILIFLVDLRVSFEQIFFVSKRFRCCTSEIQISLLLRQRLKLKSGFFFLSLLVS